MECFKVDFPRKGLYSVGMSVEGTHGIVPSRLKVRVFEPILF